MKKLLTILFFAVLITGCRKEIQTGVTEIGYTKNDGKGVCNGGYIREGWESHYLPPFGAPDSWIELGRCDQKIRGGNYRPLKCENTVICIN